MAMCGTAQYVIVDLGVMLTETGELILAFYVAIIPTVLESGLRSNASPKQISELPLLNAPLYRSFLGAAGESSRLINQPSFRVTYHFLRIPYSFPIQLTSHLPPSTCLSFFLLSTIQLVFRSFASDAEGTWRIISMETEDDDITKIDASTARELFDLSSLASQGVQGVKDPWLVKDQDMLYMVISVALVDTTLTDEHHGTKDIYNTGLCTSGSALAISNNNGRDWQWHGVILEAPGIDTSWDGYCRRMNCAFQSGGLWFSFYDGIPNEKHNYEEKTGLCMARAITGPWTVHTVQEPLFVSTHATGAMRYFEVQNMGETSIEDGALVFFECAREDGAHELRLARCHTDELIPQEYSALTTLHPGPLCGACDHSGGYTNRRLCTIQ